MDKIFKSQPCNERRAGVIHVTAAALNDELFFNWWEKLRLFPTRAEYVYSTASFRIEGYCHLFDPLDGEGMCLPHYEVVIASDPDGNCTVGLRKVA